VHEARKALKKARAALRLLRPAAGEAAYRSQNAALRDAGRCIAPLRDSRSLMDAVALLKEHYPKKARRAGLGRVAARLQQNTATARRSLLADPGTLARCSALLERDFSADGSTSPEPGLERLYRKGRKAFAEAKKAGTPDALHEWRKQVKYLMNALAIACRSGGGKAAKLAARADKLAGWLGDDHDLAALSQQARELPPLQALIERRRGKLRKRAFRLGRKLYGRKPKDFVGALLKARDPRG
jgi:CHAD domain-containing protein